MLAIALTGGPGFGKSTTLAALEARGYPVASDSARAIIRDRVTMGLPRRPTAREFADQILRRDQAQYRAMQGSQGLGFFDRGVIDALGMCHEAGAADWSGVEQVLRDYPFHRRAFVFPPWQAIYAQDAERDQSFEDAVRVDGSIRRWYARCGFELVEVPRVAVQARCNFILRSIEDGMAD